jgi:hypothetical protein
MRGKIIKLYHHHVRKFQMERFAWIIFPSFQSLIFCKKNELLDQKLISVVGEPENDLPLPHESYVKIFN